MKLWEIKKGSMMHNILLGAVTFNSHAYESKIRHEFSPDGEYGEYIEYKMNPLLGRFSGNKMNFCEVCRHLVWAVLYALVPILLIAIPLTAVFIYPAATGHMGTYMYYLYATIIVLFVIGGLWLFSAGSDMISHQRLKKRHGRIEPDFRDKSETTDSKFMDIMATGFLRVVKFVGWVLSLFGLIPVIASFVAMVYTMFKDNFCPIVTIVSDDDAVEGQP